MNPQLLEAVADHYRLRVLRHRVIREQTTSLVVQLVTSRGTYVLKTLYVSPERQRFILEAEAHLRSRGIRIPHTLFAADESPFLLWRGHPYVLQEWLPGRPYPLTTRARVERMGTVLAMFHRASLGFASPLGPLYAGHERWEEEYASDIASIRRWQRAHRESDNAKVAAIRKAAGFFLEAAERVQSGLAALPYFAVWKGLPLEQHYLCHGDFHPANVCAHRGSVGIIDWEDVRYDFPSKDLSRLLFATMRREGSWNPGLWKRLYRAYRRVLPLSCGEERLLFTDLAFPHQFERFLRKELYRAMPLDGVRSFLARERKKTLDFLIQAGDRA